MRFGYLPKKTSRLTKLCGFRDLPSRTISQGGCCARCSSAGQSEVYKALRNELAAVLAELQRIEAGGSVNEELLDTIELIAVILGGLKGESEDGE